MSHLGTHRLFAVFMSTTHKQRLKIMTEFLKSLISQNLDNRTLCTVNECARVHPAIGEVIKLQRYDWFSSKGGKGFRHHRRRV